MEKTKEKKPREKKARTPKPPKETKDLQIIETPAEISQPLVPIDYKTKLTKEQVALIKRTIAVGATDDELKMFLYVCERSKLDPFTKQIYFVKRWDSKEGKEKGAVQVGIDGLRSIAERAGQYAGNDDPVFDGEQTLAYKDEKISVPAKATTKVYKMIDGQRCEFVATARWTEYYPGEKQGFMWRSKPYIMLGKCAEALALRKAFPAVLSGLYITEEMEQNPAIKAPEQQAEDAFAKAKHVIAKQENKATLEDFKKKVEGSKLYSAAQKKDLAKAIDTRIAALDQEHAVDQLSEAQDPVEALGDIVGGKKD